MKHKTIICVILAVILAFPVFADDPVIMPALSMPSMASNGFGGHHVAYTDNVYSLLVNPAAMMRTQQSSWFTLSPSLYSPGGVFEALKAMGGGLESDMIKQLVPSIEKLAGNGRMVLGLDLPEFPLSIAWVANGFGFGLWNRTHMTVKVDGITSGTIDVYADVMLPIGMAFKVLDFGGAITVDAGITVKPFARTWISETINPTSLMSSIDNLADNLSAPLIAGGALDAGLMLRMGNFLSAGLTFNNIFSHGVEVYNLGTLNGKEREVNKNTVYKFPFTMNAGAAMNFNLFNIMGLAVALDLRDISNYFAQDNYLNRNWILNLGLGAELSMFNFLKVRAGISDMLPSVGLGLHFGAFKIDFAYFGQELGNEPGHRSTAVAGLSLSIRPQAKQRDWAWTRNAFIGF